ncbi:unnamed protein product [Dibothriocephalus latus]|uniref:Uncharacterized protein n=1 Tax=Dibothriocephalus latus TaxID=60516 RepID=A0A3P7MDE0_DIBLA|nr:unnamed protein product [Dibothriocephalus latus]
MELRRLTATLLGIAVAAIIIALAIPHWGCGNLIEDCPRGYDRDAIIAVAALLIIDVRLVGAGSTRQTRVLSVMY